MKPELVSFSPAGHHNESIDQAYLRIMEGASWKKQRVVWITPASDTMSTKVAFAQMGVFPPPNQPFVRTLALGMEVGDAYCNTIEGVLAHPELSQWEYILTVEHDNAPPADGLVQLLKRAEEYPDIHAFSGLYWTKGYGGVPQIWGDINDPIVNFRPQPPDLQGGLKRCYGIGMGFALFRMAMFRDERLRKPWFRTVASAEEGVGTQDLWFWADAAKYGYRCAVDCSVRVGHYDLKERKMW